MNNKTNPPTHTKQNQQETKNYTNILNNIVRHVPFHAVEYGNRTYLIDGKTTYEWLQNQDPCLMERKIPLNADLSRFGHLYGLNTSENIYHRIYTILHFMHNVENWQKYTAEIKNTFFHGRSVHFNMDIIRPRIEQMCSILHEQGIKIRRVIKWKPENFTYPEFANDWRNFDRELLDRKSCDVQGTENIEGILPRLALLTHCRNMFLHDVQGIVTRGAIWFDNHRIPLVIYDNDLLVFLIIQEITRRFLIEKRRELIR